MCNAALVKLAVAQAKVLTKDRAGIIIDDLIDDGWRAEDFLAVVKTIKRDHELLSQITFEGGITLGLMRKGKERLDTGKVADLGKCYTEYCNKRATVKKWGEVYCAGCHDEHVRKIARRSVAR